MEHLTSAGLFKEVVGDSEVGFFAHSLATTSTTTAHFVLLLLKVKYTLQSKK